MFPHVLVSSFMAALVFVAPSSMALVAFVVVRHDAPKNYSRISLSRDEYLQPHFEVLSSPSQLSPLSTKKRDLDYYTKGTRNVEGRVNGMVAAAVGGGDGARTRSLMHLHDPQPHDPAHVGNQDLEDIQELIHHMRGIAEQEEY